MNKHSKKQGISHRAPATWMLSIRLSVNLVIIKAKTETNPNQATIARFTGKADNFKRICSGLVGDSGNKGTSFVISSKENPDCRRSKATKTN